MSGVGHRGREAYWGVFDAIRWRSTDVQVNVLQPQDMGVVVVLVCWPVGGLSAVGLRSSQMSGVGQTAGCVPGRHMPLGRNQTTDDAAPTCR
jgi:hypothetical protein